MRYSFNWDLRPHTYSTQVHVNIEKRKPRYFQQFLTLVVKTLKGRGGVIKAPDKFSNLSLYRCLCLTYKLDSKYLECLRPNNNKNYRDLHVLRRSSVLQNSWNVSITYSNCNNPRSSLVSGQCTESTMLPQTLVQNETQQLAFTQSITQIIYTAIRDYRENTRDQLITREHAAIQLSEIMERTIQRFTRE